jgi:hypothetical protein
LAKEMRRKGVEHKNKRKPKTPSKREEKKNH